MEDAVYRIMTVLLIIAMEAARWPRRRELGGDAARSARKRNPGDAMLLRACRTVWGGVLAVYVTVPQWIAFGALDLPAACRWGGVVIGLSGTLLVLWADCCLGSNLSGIVQIKEQQTLVTSGPYRWVRHPIYTGGLLFCVGQFLTSANVCVGMGCVGGAVLLYVTRIPKEEKMLLDRFGNEYRNYANRTGRFLPKWF